MSTIRDPATITKVGRQMMTAGGDITYTKAVLYGQDISHLTKDQLESLTSIGNPLMTVPVGISDKSDNGNGTTVVLEATFQNTNLKTDLPYTAVGFFAKRGDEAEKLVAVGVATDGAYLAATSPDGIATDALDIKVAIAIGDSANVTAMIDPAGSVTPTELHNSITDVKTEMHTALDLKADKVDLEPLAKTADVQAGLDTKANKTAVDSDVKSINDTLATKADKQTVTDDLAKKADKTDVDTQIGTVTKSVSDLSDTVKANRYDTDKVLATKADKATVESELSTKANQSDLDKTNAEVAKKANSDDVKAQIDGVGKSISDVSDTVKANKDAADQALATKADKTDVAKDIDTVNKSISSMSATITANQKATDTALDTKADKTTVNQELATKANSTDVDDKLAAKADSADVTKQIKTITDLANTKADQTALDATNATVATKANSTDVYTKTDTDKLLDAKADKAAVEQSLSTKANSADVAKELATKADSSALDVLAKTADVNKQLDTKADKTALDDYDKTIDVDSKIKTVTDLANSKVDADYSYSKAELDKKLLALSTDTGGKVDASIFTQALDNKADKADVDKQIKTVTDLANTKADQTSLDATNQTVATKANSSDVNNQLTDIKNNFINTTGNEVDNQTVKCSDYLTNTTVKFNSCTVSDAPSWFASEFVWLTVHKFDDNTIIQKLTSVNQGNKGDVAVRTVNSKGDVTRDWRLFATNEDINNLKSVVDTKADTTTVNSQVEDAKNTAQSKLDQAKSDLTSLIDNIKNFNVDSYKGGIPSTDMNKITDAGLYGFSNTILTNSPYRGNRWGLLLVIREFDNDPNNIDQFITSNGSLFWRNISLTNNRYPNWKRFADDGDITNLQNAINTKANSSDVYTKSDVDYRTRGTIITDYDIASLTPTKENNNYRNRWLVDQNVLPKFAEQINQLKGRQNVDGADFNNLTDSGVYYISEPQTNRPVGHWGTLIVSNGNDHRLIQLYYADDNTPPWYRTKVEGNWFAWTQLASASQVNNAQNTANQAKDLATQANTNIGKIDLSPYAKTVDVNNELNSKADKSQVNVDGSLYYADHSDHNAGSDILGQHISGGFLKAIVNYNEKPDSNALSDATTFAGGDGAAGAMISISAHDHHAKILSYDDPNGQPNWTEDIAFKSDINSTNQTVSALQQTIKTLNDTLSSANATIKTLQDTITKQDTTITGLQTQVNNQANEIKQLQETTIKGKTFSKSQEAAAEAWESQNSQQIAFIRDKQ